jgi:multidrug efflux pump subunit AcrB
MHFHDIGILLLYLTLVAGFRSFVDPVLIMLAIPMGIIGALVILVMTGTTLNVMSLMGVLMLVGAGSEQHAPTAQAVIGGLSASVLLTIFIIPAAYVLIYQWREATVSHA